MEQKAFTLIELLIVVAIIAILALIAVPNFLEAQVRAKVSRVKNDLRSDALAVESYRVDQGHYPPFGQPPYDDIWDVNALNPALVTTPIAYLTSRASLIDPFCIKRPVAGWWTHQYHYRNFDDHRYDNPSDRAWVLPLYGWWRFTSCGPDCLIFNETFDGDDNPYREIPYDLPTARLVSAISSATRNGLKAILARLSYNSLLGVKIV